MITLEKAGAEDLETIIAIQRASFKAVYEKYQDEYDPYLEDRERIKWKPVSYTHLDVYKRQTSAFPKKTGISRIPSKLRAAMFS